MPCNPRVNPLDRPLTFGGAEQIAEIKRREAQQRVSSAIEALIEAATDYAGSYGLDSHITGIIVKGHLDVCERLQAFIHVNSAKETDAKEASTECSTNE